MLPKNNTGELNVGVVVLLGATVFIAICIGVVAWQASSLVPGQSNQTVNVETNESVVRVNITTVSSYSSITATYAGETRTVTKPTVISFERTASKNTLIVKGKKETGLSTQILQKEIPKQD